MPSDLRSTRPLFALDCPKTAIPLPATIGQSESRPLLPVSANEAFLESGHVMKDVDGRLGPIPDLEPRKQGGLTTR
jgi:hypothetical protein